MNTASSKLTVYYIFSHFACVLLDSLVGCIVYVGFLVPRAVFASRSCQPSFLSSGMTTLTSHGNRQGSMSHRTHALSSTMPRQTTSLLPSQETSSQMEASRERLSLAQSLTWIWARMTFWHLPCRMVFFEGPKQVEVCVGLLESQVRHDYTIREAIPWKLPGPFGRRGSSYRGLLGAFWLLV